MGEEGSDGGRGVGEEGKGMMKGEVWGRRDEGVMEGEVWGRRGKEVIEAKMQKEAKSVEEDGRSEGVRGVVATWSQRRGSLGA